MNKTKHIHLTAACGMGMGAFAGLLVQSGYRVTGSDQNVYPPMSTQLINMGITLMSPYSPSNLDDVPDLAIIGNAVKKDNVEAAAIMERNIPYMSFPEALQKFFLKDKTSLVVAGTHGKTTTSSMVSWILESSGRDPGFLIGGILKNFNKSCKLGSGKYFVVEGDEYDTAFFDKGPKFIHYEPSSVILTSVEFDHGDIYKDIEHIKSAFTKLIHLIPQSGYLIACRDFEHVREILPSASCNVDTYGFSDGSDWTPANVVLGEKSRFSVMYQGKKMGDIELSVPGKHNILNALGAAALLFRQGLTFDEISKALSLYLGVKRRQDVRGVAAGVTVIDDFAHHPTKVKATVSAIRAKYPDGRVWAIFEPRTNSSRRAFFQKDYVLSFDDADKIIVASVFHKEQIAENERFCSEKLVEDLTARGCDAYYIPTTDEIVDFVKDRAAFGDVVLIMSNGGFDGIHDKILKALECRMKMPA